MALYKFLYYYYYYYYYYYHYYYYYYDDDDDDDDDYQSQQQWDPGFLELYSGIQIPREKVFLGESKNFPDSGIRVPLYGAILSNAVINHYTESTCIVDQLPFCGVLLN